MEPRVGNLVLSEQELAIFGLDETPAKASHYVIDSRLSKSDAISSRSTRQNLNLTLFQHPLLNDESETEEQNTRIEVSGSLDIGRKAFDQVSPVNRQTEWLDSSILNLVEEGEDGESHIRKRVHGDSSRTLPRLSSSNKADGRSKHAQPLLPPLLPPLHEPPPDARLMPPMSTDSYNGVLDLLASTDRGSLNLSSPSEPRPAESSKTSVIQSEKSDSIVTSNRKPRNLWTEQETKDLLDGVARYGIGSWKKILACMDYHFTARSPVDLKDRFRTLHPKQYGSKATKHPDEPTNYDSCFQGTKPLKVPATSAEKDQPSTTATLASRTFPRRERRDRRKFTEQEDEALLQGFRKHGAQWRRIRLDPDLGLETRSRTDLRDRFRNKFPSIFAEAGFAPAKMKRQPKHRTATIASNLQTAEDPIKSQENSLALPVQDNSAGTLRQSGPPGPSFSVPFPLPIEKANKVDSVPFYLEAPESISLNRNILDWVDQNVQPFRNDAPESWGEANTVSRMDQFHINPLLAMKVPTTVHTVGPANAASHHLSAMSLSDILNNSEPP